MYSLEIKYIDSSEIITEVKNELSTFFEKGALDESYLYPPLRQCITKMGLKIFPLKKAFLGLDDGRVELPCDFYKVEMAMGCGLSEEFDIDYLNPKFREYYVSGVNVCETDCDYCSDNCGNLYSIIQKYDSYSVVHSDLFMLKVSGSDEYCTADYFKKSWDKNNPNEITIRNGYIYANFKQGSIYLEYLSNLITEDAILIPDQETIKHWIKMEMMFACLKKLYLNFEGDVQQRLMWVQSQLAIAQTNASTIYKRWEVKEIYDIRKVLRSRFMKFRTAVDGLYYDPNSLYGAFDQRFDHRRKIYFN